MRFLEENEIQDWCNNQGIALDLPFDVLRRVQYSDNGISGEEFSVAKECIATIGEWSECLLLVTEWGIWPSSEDWPSYYSARGSFNEKRSIEIAPAHLFQNHESLLLLQFLTLVLQNGWSAYIIPVLNPMPKHHIYVYVSHNEWLEFRVYA